MYNVLGEKVGYMYDSIGAGKMKFQLDSLFNYKIDVPFVTKKFLVPGSTLTNGVYFYKLITETDTITKKMVLLK